MNRDKRRSSRIGLLSLPTQFLTSSTEDNGNCDCEEEEEGGGARRERRVVIEKVEVTETECLPPRPPLLALSS